ARGLGGPEGPLRGKRRRGEPVGVHGRIVRPEGVVGPPRPGRKIVYPGGTRPTRRTVEVAREADLLIHDATFSHDEVDRARTTGHSTAREAAEVARRAGVLRLALTHISSRYADDPRVLEGEARAVLHGAFVASDGLEFEVP